jgi:hypothetical protein
VVRGSRQEVAILIFGKNGTAGECGDRGVMWLPPPVWVVRPPHRSGRLSEKSRQARPILSAAGSAALLAAGDSAVLTPTRSCASVFPPATGRALRPATSNHGAGQFAIHAGQPQHLPFPASQSVLWMQTHTTRPLARRAEPPCLADFPLFFRSLAARHRNTTTFSSSCSSATPVSASHASCCALPMTLTPRATFRRLASIS